MSRFAAYLRVSTTDKQDPALSFPSQLKACKAKAAESGGSVVCTFDDQASGARDDRPGWGKLMAEARNPERRFDGVLVYSTSRLARDRMLAALYERDLQKLGVQIEYARGGGDTSTPEGAMFVGMQQLWDAFERDKLVRETKRGMSEGTSQGFRMGGRAPFGYRRQGTDLPAGHQGADKQRVRLVREPDEAQVVAEVFDLHGAQCWGLKKIAEHLNRPGGPPPPVHVDSSRNRGGHWATSTLRSILRNHVYTGTLVWNRLDFADARRQGGGPKLRAQEDWVVLPDAHEAIVSEAIFQHSQARFGTRHSRQSTGAASSRRYLFAGMVFCCSGHQPLSMQGKCRKKSPTYNCGYGATYSDNAAVEVHGGAKWVSLREDALLPLVEDFFAERIFGPLRLEKLAAQLNSHDKSAAKAGKLKASRLQTALADLDRKLKAQVCSTEEGVPADIVRERIAELTVEREAAQHELDQLTPGEVAADHDHLARRLSRLPDLAEQLHGASPEVQREVFQAFELRVEFDKGNGRIGISTTVSEAVARAFADVDGTLRVPVRDIAGGWIRTRDLRVIARRWARRRRAGVNAERLRNQPCVLGPRRVMEIAHRRLDVGVAHPLLHPADVRLSDHPRAERVPEIVEAQRPQLRPSRRCLVAAAQRRAVEEPAGLAGEYQLVIAREPVALESFANAFATSGASGTERTLPDLGVVRAPPA